jgi:hypothetical protein
VLTRYEVKTFLSNGVENLGRAFTTEDTEDTEPDGGGFGSRLRPRGTYPPQGPVQWSGMIWRGFLLVLVGVLPGWARAEDCRPAKAVEIAVSANHTCARMDDGSARCWGGENGWRGLYVGWSAPRANPELRDTTQLQKVGAAICGLTKSGDIRCWDIKGDRPADVKAHDPLGPASFGLRFPEAAAGFGRVEAFWFAYGMFARRADGTVLRWGTEPWSPSSPLRAPHASDPTSGKRRGARAFQVPALKGAIRVEAGNRWGCAWWKDGKVRCWGLGPWSPRHGLPDDFMEKNVAPYLAGALDLSVGGIDELYAVLNDGSLRRWKANYVGNGRIEIQSSRLTDLPRASQVTWGVQRRLGWGFDAQTCIVAEGKVLCWTDREPKPISIAGLNDVVSVGFGWEHGCALIRDGSVRCWGENNLGQLGDGTTDRREAPSTVAWCATNGQPIEYSPPSGVPQLIHVDRDGASAGCPSYRLDLYADGTIIYHGRASVAVRAAREKKLPEAKLAAGSNLIRSTRFPEEDGEWRERYVNNRVDDGENEDTIIEIPQAGHPRHLQFGQGQCGVPPDVLRLVLSLDNLATEWTGGPSEHCLAWRKIRTCPSDAPDGGQR